MGIKDITWEGVSGIGLETIFYYTFFLYTRWHGRFLPIVWSLPILPRMARTAWGDFVALPTLSLLLITAETTQDSCILLGAGNEY